MPSYTNQNTDLDPAQLTESNHRTNNQRTNNQLAGSKYISNYVFSSSNHANITSGGGMPLSSFINPAVLTTVLVGGEIENPDIPSSNQRTDTAQFTGSNTTFVLEKEYYIPGGLVVSSWLEEPRECVSEDPSEVPVMLEKWDDLWKAVEVRELDLEPKSRISNTHSSKVRNQRSQKKRNSKEPKKNKRNTRR